MSKSEFEKVLFKDIVRSCSFKKVKDALLELYPDQRKSIKGYKYVFNILKLMRPGYSKEGLVIEIEKVGRGKNAYFSVSGICVQEETKQSYALEYMPWSEWLGCKVGKQVINKMTKEEITAHCLWEMTFMGFTQDKIRSRLSVLRRRVKDIEDGKAKTIPYEEVMARIKDKLKNG